MTTTEPTPTAADTGASATAAFRATRTAGPGVDPERVATLISAMLSGLETALRTHRATYPEFNAAKAWLMRVGEAGEWPLFLDVFVEHIVEEIAATSQRGSTGSILGPFYLPGRPQLPAVATLPMREAEKGERLVLAGQVRGIDGNPLPGAELDVWQADADGYYSGFAAGVPDGNLRGVVIADADGRFQITTILPAPYRIPTDGPTGRLIQAAGWHPWRPAHLHLIVRAAGHRALTTQLFFDGGDWLDSDVASATKPELILSPVSGPGGIPRAEYDFILEPT